MGKISSVVLVRSIDLLLIVALCKNYSTVQCLYDFWRQFVAAPEIAQIGTMTCIVFVGRTISMSVAEVVGHMRCWWRTRG